MDKTGNILQTDNISKNFKSTRALKNINIEFSNKGIYGLFGRNGAGKTTLLNIITARIYADKGEVSCYNKKIGKHPDAINENCCYMPEKHLFPPYMKVKKLLSYGKMSYPNFDRDYCKKLCERFELDINKKYENLSRGYQSIFRIVLGLSAQAPITIFDEPILGLDPYARDIFYQELVEDYGNNPRLFIISTHIIEESSDIFDEVIILKNGEVILNTPVEDLQSKAFYVSGKSQIVDNFLANRKVLNYESVNNMKMAVVEGNINNENQVPELEFSTITIQKLFINLTNNLEKKELLL